MPHLQRRAEQSTAGRRLETGTGNTDRDQRHRAVVRPVLSCHLTRSRWLPQSAHCAGVQPNPWQVVRGGPGPGLGCIYILLVCGQWSRPSSSTAAPH